MSEGMERGMREVFVQFDDLVNGVLLHACFEWGHFDFKVHFLAEDG